MLNRRFYGIARYDVLPVCPEKIPGIELCPNLIQGLIYEVLILVSGYAVDHLIIKIEVGKLLNSNRDNLVFQFPGPVEYYPIPPLLQSQNNPELKQPHALRAKQLPC